MKSNLTVIILLILFCLTACSNKAEFAYNEKVAHDFYSCKERLDESFEKFTNGAFDSNAFDTLSHEIKIKQVKGLASYCKETKDFIEVNFEPTENSIPFHKEILNYFYVIETEYATLLEKYIVEQDSVSRTEIKNQLNNKKRELEVLEDKCLEKQIEFLNKAGIKINASLIKKVII